MKGVSNMQTTAAAANDIGWRQFPEFEKILGDDPGPLLARVERTCRQLNDIIKSGSDADKQRAQSAMTAYGRSLDLLHLLTEIRTAQQQGQK